MAEKDPEALFRDRLINDNEVAPVLERINKSAALVIAVFAAAVLGLNVASGFSDPYEQYSSGYLSQLKSDDALASREQQRAQGRGTLPLFCDDARYRARASGALCD